MVHCDLSYNCVPMGINIAQDVSAQNLNPSLERHPDATF